MTSRVRLRVILGAMMFFQYAVWGAWTPILGDTLGSRMNATGAQLGAVYGVLWLACIITPFIGGQLVDRLMPSQIFMGLAAIVCTVSAWMMSQQQHFPGLIGWMWVWSIAFAPTLGIANSIVFYHLSKEGTSEVEQERDFSFIRTAGTVGWIVVNLLLSYYLYHKPEVPKGTWAPYEEMQFTAIAGVLLTIVCFLIPNTPPSKEKKDPFAFLKAFTLFKTVPGFAIFMFISFFVSTEFQFYYVLNAPFLHDLGIPHSLLSATKSTSQFAEIISMAVFLPISLKLFGMRKTLVIGTFAWPLRYFIFALQKPLWLIIISLMFHGIGFAFVFVTSYIYIDRVASKDIRGSAQSLYTLMTLGVGNWLGTMFCGWLKDHYTTFIPDPHQVGHLIPGPVNWPMVFMVPGILTTICGLAFWATFREPKSDETFVEEAALPANV